MKIKESSIRTGILKIWISILLFIIFLLGTVNITEAEFIKSGSLELGASDINGINFSTYESGIIMIDLDIRLANGGYTSEDQFSLELQETWG